MVGFSVMFINLTNFNGKHNPAITQVFETSFILENLWLIESAMQVQIMIKKTMYKLEKND